MLKVDWKRGRQIGGAGEKGGETEERMRGRGRWEERRGQSIREWEENMGKVEEVHLDREAAVVSGAG
jgi:hypothetical protein